MSAKITKTSTAKTAKTVTKTVAPVAKVGVVRLTEADKAADTATYIVNSATGKYVKRNTALGKKLIEAETAGTEVTKAMTDTERLILVVKTLMDNLSIGDDKVKQAMEPIEDKLPRGFPAAWGGKHKNPRHVDHPKGPSNAYIFFTKANRESTVSSNPDLTNTEIVSLMSKMWNETSKKDRIEYENQALADKERYEEEMKIFEEAHPELARASTKAALTPEKPVKSTAYMLFCRDNREAFKAENEGLDGKEITKLLAEEWALIKEDKAKLAEWQEAADAANEDFEERMSDYSSSPKGDKKLSVSEQKKADDPENFELNPKTGRYVKKSSSPKKASPKTTPKKVTKKKVTPGAPKKATKVEKEVEEVKEEDILTEDEDDENMIN